MKKRLFITFDGRHGTGKSFLADKLSRKLTENNYQVYVTNEPTDSEIGRLSRAAENIYFSEALVCLFAADRYIHCLEMQKMFDKGIIVICDRYLISGLILQNMDGIDFDYISKVNMNILKPDISVVLTSNNQILNDRLLCRHDTISRLARQEMTEGRDRYLDNISFLSDMFENLMLFENNTIEDANSIVDSLFLEICKFECNAEGSEENEDY